MIFLYIYLLLVGIFLIWLGLFVWSLTFTKAPFVPIPRKVLGKISEALEIRPGDAVYDLGCGDGRVLIACHKKEPKARYIGIDKALAAVSVAKLRVLPLYSENMLILRGDFMKQNLSAADRVFTYLYPGLMDELLPKLEKELHPGTRLVSCDFPFSKKKAKEVIDLERPKLTGQKLYIYEF